MQRIAKSIFKAYDIRGIVPTEIDTAVAYTLGRAFATLLIKRNPGKRLKIAVGGDMRLTTPELKTYFMGGAADVGVDVDDFGQVSTPTFYFGVGFFEYDGGAQVTASHNPKEWNGFKVVGYHASPIGKDSGIEEMHQMIDHRTLAPFVEKEQKGAIHSRTDILQRAISEQRGPIAKLGEQTIHPFRIAIDSGNGMGGEDMQKLFETLPCAAVWLNEKPDGNFPAHPADPMVEENTRDLRRVIIERECNLGIATDGDGDRYFFFDEKGEVVPQEILRGIIAQIELGQNPGAKIVHDARPGRITTDLIIQSGGTPVMAPVGHSLIKEVMISEDAVFGGESSGHFFYKLPYGTFEAPIVLVTRFLEYISKLDKPLSEIVAPHKRYANSGEINTHLESRELGLIVLEKIKKAYAGGKQHFIDGLSIEFPDFWFSVRLSNTEPLIRLIVESPVKTTMETKRDEILSLIQAM
ncbi:MAG: phosphomannomutase/phosphoglucomutase [Bdellovibrionia bacterium]